MNELSVIILAAGKSTRMKSSRSKLLHEVGGKKVITRVCRAVASLEPACVVAVCSFQADEVFHEVKHVLSNAVMIDQGEPRGTGHAVLKGLEGISESTENILVLAGDIPLIKPETLSELIKKHSESSSEVSFITMMCAEPFGYGRVIRRDSHPVHIMEQADLTTEFEDIKECNSGIYIFRRTFLQKYLESLNTNNAKGEFYLTDLIKKAAEISVVQTTSAPESEVTGVNTRVHFAYAEAQLLKEIVNAHMVNGVGFLFPDEVYIHESVTIGQDSFIEKDVVLKGNTQIGNNVYIGQGAIIVDSVIGDNVEIKPYSVIEASSVGIKSVVGPFARLRPGNDVGENCRIGNFVEMKKVTMERGVKAGHLSYLGDASIGEDSNIGAGTITCNYDGKNKFRTILGKRVFVGSDSQLIAPVTVGDDTYIGTGTTVMEDAEGSSLVINPKTQKVVNPWKPPYLRT